MENYTFIDFKFEDEASKDIMFKKKKFDILTVWPKQCENN